MSFVGFLRSHTLEKKKVLCNIPLFINITITATILAKSSVFSCRDQLTGAVHESCETIKVIYLFTFPHKNRMRIISTH